MNFPKEYIVWNVAKLGLDYNLLPNNENPFFWDIKDIEKSDEWLSKVFNKNNTLKVYYIEYCPEPGYEVVVLIIKCKNVYFTPIKDRIKKEDFRKVENAAGAACKEIFFFDNENSVILNIGSVDALGRKKALEMSKAISKNLPNLEKFG